MKVRMRRIKKEVVRRIQERYADFFEQKYAPIEKQLLELEEIGSGKEHKYTEKQYIQKKQDRIDREIRERKEKEIKKAIDSIINCNYGLTEDGWKIDRYTDEEIVGFLVALVSTKYENRRFIYKETVENETQKYNKNLFRDLQICSPSIDVIEFCEYILEQSNSEPEFSSDYVAVLRQIQSNVSLRIGRDTWWKVGSEISKLIQRNKICLKKEIGLNCYNVTEIYTVVNLGEQAIEDLIKGYYRIENTVFNLKKFFETVNRTFLIREKKLSEEINEETIWENIYREYAWRLLCQTTIREYECSLSIYDELKKGVKERQEYDLKYKQEIDEVLKWYCLHQYIDIRIDNLKDEVYQNLYNEIYVDKNKWNRNTALQIARKIQRGEYERNGNLTEEILFLQAKITRAFRNLSEQQEKEYTEVVILLKKTLLQVWNICKKMKYNPDIILALDYEITIEWMNFIGK